MDNMKVYELLQTPPNDALGQIKFGALKGKNDINPQWRYEALTNAFGPCGIGWKFVIVDRFTEAVQATGELMVFIVVNLYIRNDDGGWSEPIPGFGGDFLIVKDKNGIHGNDEAIKMAVTDALGTAAKMLGVAADVYRGIIDKGVSDSKYVNRQYAEAAVAEANKKQIARNNVIKSLKDEVARIGCTWDEVKAIAKVKLGKTDTHAMSTDEIGSLCTNLEQWIAEQVHG